MRLLPAVVSAAALLLTAGVAHASHGGALIPPVRVDVGSALSGTQAEPGMQLLAGIHWASLYPGDTPIDLGVGLVSTHFGPFGDADATSEGARARAASSAEPLELLGGYAEAALRHGGARWWRGWLGTRVEWGKAALDGRDHDFLGVATRCTVEIFGGTAGGDSRNAFVLGTAAIGAYAEVSARRIETVGIDVGASVGMTFRVPFIVAGA